jgi:predicted small lipoprotein YifL
MRKWLIPAVVIGMALALAGCGRKEPPVPVADTAPPAIASLTHAVHVNALEIDMVLTAGDPAGVGYELDRAPIDPYCHCVGFWRRYRVAQVRPERVGAKTKVLLDLRSGKLEYAFRVRAVDSLGRLGPWSKVIRARSQLKLEE